LARGGAWLDRAIDETINKARQRITYDCGIGVVYLVNTLYAEFAKTIQNIPPECRPPDLHDTVSSRVLKYASGKTVGINDLKWTS
jgi:hypothetical protein